MRRAHAACPVCRVPELAKSPHVRAVANRYKERDMFVRAVWRLRRLIDLKQALREMEVPSTRGQDLLGITPPDFSKMTRGLFDR